MGNRWAGELRRDLSAGDPTVATHDRHWVVNEVSGRGLMALLAPRQPYLAEHPSVSGGV